MRRTILFGVCAGLATVGAAAARAETPTPSPAAVAAETTPAPAPGSLNAAGLPPAPGSLNAAGLPPAPGSLAAAGVLPAPPGSPAAAGVPLVPPGSPPAPQPFSSWEFGATGETIFEHTRAGLRDPHFGMRLYRDNAVPGTLNPIANPVAGADTLAGVPNGAHTFWDVSFGESMPVFTWFNVNPERARYARGIQFNLDAGAFMLLDFDSQSSGVIDTDFRLGGSFDLRPWWDGWEHLSLKVGFFHESTHLGDEYVLSAGTIQGQAPPTANATLPYRANPSYEGLPVTLSFDSPLPGSNLSARVYAGAEAYFWSALPNGTFPSEWRAGAELRWTSFDGADAKVFVPEDAPLTDRLKANVLRRSTGVHHDQVTTIRADRVRRRRGAFTVEGAYELLAKRRYDHVGVEPGGATFVSADGFWYIQHATVMGLYNLDTERSSSNAVGLSVDWIRGRSPFGQLTEYAHVDTIALGLSYYW